jgi:tyrosinase
VAGREEFLVRESLPARILRFLICAVDWNWYLDTPDAGGSFTKSPLFDPVSGFGGNGKKATAGAMMGLPSFGTRTGGGCLVDGPFANRTLRIGPMGYMKPNNPRCLTRDFNPQMAEASATKALMARLMKAKSYKNLMHQMEELPPPTFEKGVFKFQGDVHSIGHYGIGGEVPFTLTERVNAFY